MSDQLEGAIKLHQAGDFQGAEALYRSVLARDPRQADAHHNLAILRMQAGAQIADVVAHFRAAWQENPDQPQYGISLLRALVLSGLEAEADIVHAVARQRGVSLPSPAVFRPAREAATSPLKSPPSPDLIARLRGAHARGDHAELRRLAERASSAAPGVPEVWKYLAIALESLGDPSSALVHARRALQLGREDKETLQLAARLAQAAGLVKEAIRLHQMVVARWQDEASTWAALAACHKTAREFPEARTAAGKAISIDSGLAAGWACLGAALLELGETGPAEEALGQALRLDIDSSEAFNALGQLLLSSGRKAAAEELCRRMIEHRPQHAEALYTLGTLQMDEGRLQEAREVLSRVAELAPAQLAVRSTLLFIGNYLQDQPARDRLQEAVRFGRDASQAAQATLPAWRGDWSPPRLRIGLVSPDLRAHPVGYFMEGILASPAARPVDWLAYSSAPYTDETTARLRPRFTEWRNLNGLSDADCARLIRADGVHVLVDLAGHTLFNRLPVFAWRLAPAQVSWLGYFATTGLPTMDYLMADADCLPEQLEGEFVERIWRLPTRLCFTPPREAPAVRAAPSSEGAPVTFGCFQAYPKITDEMLALWSRLLAATPNTRLRLQNAQLAFEEVKLALQTRLTHAGIDPARIELAGPAPRRRYLEDLGAVDLLLDTHPYPGGTTTCEALWMGVPTITLAGNSMLSRQGASILRAAGLPDWVAYSPDEYLDLAARKARDTGALAALRRDLRARLPQTPLFDADGFASALLAALSAMWGRAAEQRPRRE